MPRGGNGSGGSSGRRGRFWQRFHRDDEPQYEEIHVPPPPPPPNVDSSHHWRWSFSTSPRRGRRKQHSSHRLKESTSADGSPPRWGDDDYDDVASMSSESHTSNSDICFICGDLLSSHPEVPTIHLFDKGPLVPTIHLCDKGDYSVDEEEHTRGHVGQGCSKAQGVRPRVRQREHRRAHSVGGPIHTSPLPPPRSPSRSATLPPYASSTKSKTKGSKSTDSQELGSQDTLVLSPDDGTVPPPPPPALRVQGPQQISTKSTENMDTVQRRLKDAQEALESVRMDLQKICCGGEQGDKSADQGFTENLLNDLQGGLKEQYTNFISQVKQEMQEKSMAIEAEVIKIKAEKTELSRQLEEVEAKGKEVQKREDELKSMQDKVDEDRATFVKECETEKGEVRRQWQKLQDEIKRMEEIHNLQQVILRVLGQGRIKLDVGGHVYTTSTSTLTRDPESMLAAMFSGRHELRQEEDGEGTVFIDRDGTHFRYILNFLRDGTTDGSLPDDNQALKELLNEAIYYQLTGLVEAVEQRLQRSSL